MAASARIDELRDRYAAQPRRYLAPLANALRQAGALEEAVTILRAQLAEYPRHLTGHVVLGQALYDTGALAEARGAFEAARTLDPGNRVVLRYLGEIASLGGDQPAARRWFGRLRAADPYADDVDAQLGGGPTEPPDADDEAPPVAAGAPPVSQEVHEVSRADAFELLEFDPVAVDAAPPPAAPDPSPATDPRPVDPVVGLDVAPPGPPPELSAASAPTDVASSGVASAEAAADEPASHDLRGEALDRITAGPFATETMAGLLAAQGHTEQAIALYERLTVERPADAGLRSRLDALRGVTAGAAAEAPPRASSSTDGERGALLAAAFADVGAQRAAASAAPAPDEASVDDAGVDAARVPDGDDLDRFDRWLRELAA